MLWLSQREWRLRVAAIPDVLKVRGSQSSLRE